MNSKLALNIMSLHLMDIVIPLEHTTWRSHTGRFNVTCPSRAFNCSTGHGSIHGGENREREVPHH